MKTSPIGRRPHCSAGFTLIEIMLVVGIIVILMGAVLKKTDGLSAAAGITATLGKINQLKSAVGAYQATSGALPSSEQGLKALVEKPNGNPVPKRWVKLLSESDLADAWKVPFAYHAPARKGGGSFEIVSAGPDKKMNTEDDISSEDEG